MFFFKGGLITGKCKGLALGCEKPPCLPREAGAWMDRFGSLEILSFRMSNEQNPSCLGYIGGLNYTAMWGLQ